MSELTKEEFRAVTKIFFERFEDAMSAAGCNDLYPDEWPESVCEKFNGDIELFDYWKSKITQEFGL